MVETGKGGVPARHLLQDIAEIAVCLSAVGRKVAGVFGGGACLVKPAEIAQGEASA